MGAAQIMGWQPGAVWMVTPREFWACWKGWRQANVPQKGGKKSSSYKPLTAEEEAERKRMLELVPDGPPPRKRGRKAIELSPGKLEAVLKRHGALDGN